MSYKMREYISSIESTNLFSKLEKYGDAYWYKLETGLYHIRIYDYESTNDLSIQWYRDGAGRVDFSTVFENSPPSVKEKFIFNMDLFRNDG